MSSLRPASVSDTTPLQRFESQSSSGEEPSSPTAASIVAAAAAAVAAASTTQPPSHPQQQQAQLHHHYNNNNNVKVDLQLPPFVSVSTGAGAGAGASVRAKPRTRGTSYIFKRIVLDLSLLSCGEFQIEEWNIRTCLKLVYRSTRSAQLDGPMEASMSCLLQSSSTRTIPGLITI